jgi:PPOX class probable F420-dependent enzyme
MRRGIPIEDLSGFLERPIVSVLATRRPDGSPLLSPVWHEWRDGGFTVTCGRDDVKVRHVRRDPRVSLVVAEQQAPYTGVEIRCEARILEEESAETVRRICVRYEGQGRGNWYADEIEGDSAILRLEPGELRTWDFADDYAAYPGV